MARTATDTITNSLEVRPLCLHGVQGLIPCMNDTLFKPALPRLISDPNYQQKTLVFFGGDIQNFLESMDTSDPQINCHRWCLESAAQRLGAHFPSHHIVVIRPTRTSFDHVNCFDNFVQNNCLGAPQHIYNYRGLVHLEKMLFMISKKIRKTASDELFKFLLKINDDDDDDNIDEDPMSNIVWQFETMPRKRKELLISWQKSLRLHKYPLTLVAFSKGCVVLNQFLYEFHYARRLEPTLNDSSFIDRIERMYYLDAAHAGRSHVYLTSRALLRTVMELGIELHVHLSQYQMDDFIRPWIREQCNEFIDLLRSFNAKLVVHHHVCKFTDLRAHFNVFLSFMRLEQRGPRAPPPRPAPPPPLAPPPAAPQPAPPTRPQTPPEREFMQREILGIALVNPVFSPYLALQLILRRPLNEIMESYARDVGLSESAASRPGPEPAASAREGAETGPAPSSHLNSPPEFSSTSSSDSPIIFIPSVPSSPNAFEPNVASAQNPGPSTSSAPGPSTSARGPPDLDQPSTSGFKRPPSDKDFTVLLKKRSTRINFETDLEALRAYESAKYYKIEAPVIATFTEGRSQSTVNIYSPVNDLYTPLILNTTRPYDVDSATASTPARGADTPGPSRAAVAGSSGQSDTPRAATHTTRRPPANEAQQASSNSQARAETSGASRPLPVPNSSSSELDMSSSDSTSSDSEPPRPARRTRSQRAQDTPYSRRGSTRYNLRSTR